MYTVKNYRTKKELKNDVDNGVEVEVYSVSMFEKPPFNGTVYLEGPHYPEPHKWYAQATVENSIIKKVK